MNNNTTSDSPLGKKVSHSVTYDPAQLFAIPRAQARSELRLVGSPPFYGEDVWNCYELSWLSNRGVPQVAIATVRIAADSRNIVESKSVKLYLNSFNQSRFAHADAVRAAMKSDLAAAVQGGVEIALVLPEEFSTFAIVSPEGVCIDREDIDVDRYHPDPTMLRAGGDAVEERLYSHLLRTKCPVTDQPDWATVMIDYRGPAIDRRGLLRYLISFREHSGFHENCVERIYLDITKQCRTARLTVYARFTRRGGVDINPLRSSHPFTPINPRLTRQ